MAVGKKIPDWIIESSLVCALLIAAVQLAYCQVRSDKLTAEAAAHAEHFQDALILLNQVDNLRVELIKKGKLSPSQRSELAAICSSSVSLTKQMESDAIKDADLAHLKGGILRKTMMSFQTLIAHSTKMIILRNVIGLLTIVILLISSLEVFLYMALKRRYNNQLAAVNTSLLLANQQLEALVVSDPLTSLLNRRGLEKGIQNEISRVLRSKQLLVALFIDCDDFKSINSKWGHNGGDLLLMRIAQVILNSVRPTDLSSRIGGDEFIVILAVNALEEAFMIADRLRERVTQISIDHNGKQVVGTVSIALDRIDPNDASIDSILNACQKSLAEAKAKGKNMIQSTISTREG
jgi:diguanylate cyclase (GGDEF)-like protein